jgi:hypothetical protein
VPALTYPAVVTLGVTEIVFVNVIVFVPVDTVALVPEMEVGDVVVPDGIALIWTELKPS